MLSIDVKSNCKHMSHPFDLQHATCKWVNIDILQICGFATLLATLTIRIERIIWKHVDKQNIIKY